MDILDIFCSLSRRFHHTTVKRCWGGPWSEVTLFDDWHTCMSYFSMSECSFYAVVHMHECIEVWSPCAVEWQLFSDIGFLIVSMNPLTCD